MLRASEQGIVCTRSKVNQDTEIKVLLGKVTQISSGECFGITYNQQLIQQLYEARVTFAALKVSISCCDCISITPWEARSKWCVMFWWYFTEREMVSLYQSCLMPSQTD